ncbi:hypothetical protein B7C42_01679 [Nocardia cerradoensis]|uniref:DUF4145 domain-containing protein n=1 Tax=Nocardia cerradoensis TaxID=85688 RepID=A0A231HCR5_9NOCA|nr:hypothetical protein [Nocardia cerradoensis]OXR46704.1 hypothetical protein B7C42_01679 [Nocardia cerradoensis]
MDVLSFVSSLVWPGVAVTGLVMFRKNLNRWMEERPQELKVAGVLEAKWREQADRVVEETAAAREGELPEGSDADWPGGRMPLALKLLDKVREVPVLAILEGWGEVEEELEKALVAWDPTTVRNRDGKPNLAQLIRRATTANELPGWVEHNYNAMRKLRNLAAHSMAVDPSQAFEFLSLADLVMNELRRRATAQSGE